MYEKMKNFNENLLKPKFWGPIIGGIALLLFILGSTFIIKYNLIDYYPEANYQILETEVERMIAENDFNSTYNLTINHYNSKTNSLEFSLGLGLATTNTNISNLGQENQTIETTRTDSTKTKFAIKRTIGFIISYISFSALIYFLIFGVLYQILLLIVYCLHKIKQLILKTSA